MQCAFIASTIRWDSKKNGPNPLIAAALDMSIEGKEQGDMSGEATSQVRGVVQAPLPDTMVVEDGWMQAVPVNTEAPAHEGTGEAGEPVEGSFEGLARMFGGAVGQPQ